MIIKMMFTVKKSIDFEERINTDYLVSPIKTGEKLMCENTYCIELFKFTRLTYINFIHFFKNSFQQIFINLKFEDFVHQIGK